MPLSISNVAARRQRDSLPENLPNNEEGPAERAVASEERALLAGAVQQLPDDFRACFLLRIEEGLSFRQIATILGLTEETARWRVFKARRKLLAPYSSAGTGEAVKCSALQRRLLALDRPDQPPPDAREHLGGCSACRDWLQRLLHAESQVAELPVPPPCEKEVFLTLFLAAGAAFPRPQTTSTRSEPIRPTLLRFPGSGSGSPREKALRKVAVAVGLTAALLLVTIGIWAWQRGASRPPAERPWLKLSLLLKAG